VTSGSLDSRAENLLRELAPRVLGAVIRRFGDFAAPRALAVVRARVAPNGIAADDPQHFIYLLPEGFSGWVCVVLALRVRPHCRAKGMPCSFRPRPGETLSSSEPKSG
jgi:hypothetical protein